jgi:hypothetical protein
MIMDTGPKFRTILRTFVLKNLVASNLITVWVPKYVPSDIDNATNGIVRFIGSALLKFLLSDENASYKKFTLNIPLNTSSVKRVQYRINLLDPTRPRHVMNALVHNPTHAYTGKNGSSRNEQNRNNPDMNANVSPVGARKAMGCPQNIEYNIPAMPLPSRNSTTPMLPLVISLAIVPNDTAGAKQAKYKNSTAGTTNRFFLNASVQSEM